MRQRTRRAGSRGIALADFIAGSIILAGAVAAWASITRAQIESAGEADRRAQARNAAVAILERARLEGIAAIGTLSTSSASAAGDADKSGFRLVRAFDVAGLGAVNAHAGRLEARPLVVESGDARRAVELRAVVAWKGDRGASDRLEVSTVVGGAP